MSEQLERKGHIWESIAPAGIYIWRCTKCGKTRPYPDPDTAKEECPARGERTIRRPFVNRALVLSTLVRVAAARVRFQRCDASRAEWSGFVHAVMASVPGGGWR